MRIFIVIPTLGAGGAERVTTLLANALVQQGNEVSILTDNVCVKPHYELDERVNLLTLPIRDYSGGSRLKSKLFPLKYTIKFRTYVREYRPDLVISVLFGIFLRVRLGLLGIHVRHICCDHTSFNRKLSWWNCFVRFKLYSMADAVTILTQKDKKILGNRVPHKVVIYNPLSFPILKEESTREKVVFCAGRLSIYQLKGFDIMLKVWAEISKDFPDWRLEIAGDGDPSPLALLAEELKISQRVRFLGCIDNMREKLSSVSIFALPSRVEGFPMVLLEAMSQGCACISFELEGAIHEMLTNEKSGIVIADGDILTFMRKLEILIRDETLRKQFGREVMAESSKFTIDHFIADWNALIKKVTKI